MHVDGVKVEEYMYLQAIMIGRPIAMIPRARQAANTMALGDVDSGLMYMYELCNVALRIRA